MMTFHSSWWWHNLFNLSNVWELPVVVLLFSSSSSSSCGKFFSYTDRLFQGVGPIYRSPEPSPALCPVCLCYGCLVLSKPMYFPSSVSRLGSFWIPPSVLWFGNCFRAINWDNLVTRFIICLSHQNPMLPIMQCLNTLFQLLCLVLSLRQDAVSGSCYSNILRSRVFSFFFFSFFPSFTPPYIPPLFFSFFWDVLHVPFLPGNYHWHFSTWVKFLQSVSIHSDSC